MLSSHLQDRFRVYVQHLVIWHTPSVAPLPRWRQPLVGYLVGLLLVGLGLGVGLVERQLLLPFSFPGVPLLFTIVLVALLWGGRTSIFCHAVELASSRLLVCSSLWNAWCL